MQNDCDVLIVGAGPVGLLTALAMSERKLGVRIVDEGWQSPRGTPTLLLHARTLELLAELGVAERLMAQGRGLKQLALYDRGALTGTLELSILARRFPMVLAIPTRAFELTLLDALVARGIAPERKHCVTSVAQDAGRVHVGLSRREFVAGNPDGEVAWREVERSVCSASFVIGADGYHSKVRRDLGIDLVNLGPIESFVICEFEVTERDERAAIVLDDEAVSGFFALPQGARFTMQVSEGLDEYPSEPALRSLVRQRAPWFEHAGAPIQWAVMTHFERALAGQFGKDRVWLAGEAAHITGPLGMQSVNAGFAEAAELARCISDVHRGLSDLDALQRLEIQWQEDWRAMLSRKSACSVGLAHPSEMVPNRERLVGCVPATGDDMRRLLARLGVNLAAPREC